MIADNVSMSKSKLYLFTLIIAVVVGGFWYWQYKFFRTPVSESTNQELQVLFESGSREVTETDDVMHSIPLDEVMIGNPTENSTPAIVEPEFESVLAADQYLDDNGFGLAVEVKGQYRFYPYQILVWHEIVNDTFNNQDLLVTFSPLTFSGLVFKREVNLERVEFGTSGKLWNSNLLMQDNMTSSLWSQVLKEAVVGELTGTKLALYPSLTISWMDFKTSFPYGEVLSSDTGFNRDYTQDPYELENYYESSSIWFPLSNDDDRLHAKTIVFGLEAYASFKAYPKDEIESTGIVNGQVGDQSVLITWDPEFNTVRGFSRQLGQEVLTFTQGEDFLIDDQTSSLWNYDGEAVGGDYWSEQLDVLILENSFWFSWAASHPETEIFELID